MGIDVDVALLDAAEWERQADDFARQTSGEIILLEREFTENEPDAPYRVFWERVRDLNERIRTAPSIKPEDKLELQRHLNVLCQQIRQEQKELRQQAQAWRNEMLEALHLVRDALSDAGTITEIQEIRDDLVRLRERLTDKNARGSRRERQSVWELWQEINRASWDRLTSCWSVNEAALRAILDDAQSRLEAKDAHTAKERIKEFQLRIATEECSRGAAAQLRSRARALWQDAGAVSLERHQRYLAYLERQVPGLKAAHLKARRRKQDLTREIAELERLVTAPGTAVATALLRGQLDERKKALAEIEEQERDTTRRLEAAEAALAQAMKGRIVRTDKGD